MDKLKNSLVKLLNSLMCLDITLLLALSFIGVQDLVFQILWDFQENILFKEQEAH